MKSLFLRLWQFDFSNCDPSRLARLTPLLLLLQAGFGAYDMVFDTGSGLYRFLIDHLSRHDNPLAAYLGEPVFGALAWALMGILAMYISAFAMASFVISVRRFGRAHFLPIFWSHFLSNIVAMLGGLLLFATLGAVAWALGYRYDSGAALIDHAYNGVLDWLKQHIPTLTILPYPLAIAAGMVFGALPGYFSHWLAHHSRLVWYCGHRGHHSAAILHPVGTGPFMFLPEIFSTLPSVLFAALATKLFYYEPLLFETLVLGALGIVVEKFNHTTVFYDFAFHNPLVRAISAYTGGGVYHYMHHTSRPGDEIVNVGGSPFLIWDRLFGTYRAPTATAPRVGLTNNPQITLSPFAIIFSGWQQIAWELKANTSWSDRWHILFGTVYWSPPLSRDFLIQGYPESAPAKP